MTRRITLALTPALVDWLAEDASWRRMPGAWRLAQRWRALWAGVNARQSAALNSEGRAPALRAPVFIVGPWRSGTTVMHELLVAATGCASPLTWQCMNAPAFSLTARPQTTATVARPMDGLAIDADSPQEDEFAMLALGIDSAYRAFLMPHRIGELRRTLDPEYWVADSSWLATWEAFLRGVLRTSPGTQPLILKSPNHSFRLKALLQRFPDARLVWVARDPVAVFHSNRKMWQAMFDAHGLSTPDPAALDDFIDEALRRCAEVLGDCLTQLPSHQLIVCSHDSLLADPAGAVNGILAQLQLPRAADPRSLSRAMDRTRAGRIDSYAKTLPDHLRQGADRLRHAQAAALASRGTNATDQRS